MKFDIVVCSSPSKRIQDMRERFLSHVPQMCSERAIIYTEVYKKNEGMPLIQKRAKALKETLSRIPLFIEKNETIVGHPASKPCSAEVFPEVNIKFMEEIEEFETREYNRLQVSKEVKKELYDIWPYWKGKTLTDHFEFLRPESVKRAIQSGLLSNPHEWSGFAHVVMDYEKILNKGVIGIKQDINYRLAELKITDEEYPNKVAFYNACLILCDGILIYAKRYSTLAEKEAEKETGSRREELIQISELLKNVPRKPARSFREAIQSFWFIQLIPQIESNGFSISPGRFDQYMWQFLKNDLENEVITVEQAQEIVDELFIKFAEIKRVDSRGAAEVNAGYASGQNLVVGGIDRFGNDCENLLSEICLAANYHVKLNQPNFTVRLHKGTSKIFLKKVINSISAGNGMPQILNDELIIESLIKHGIPRIEAYDYLPVGCDEITVHKTWGRCNGGYVSFAKILEMTMNKGADIEHEIKLNDVEVDLLEEDGFEAFLEKFDRQLAYSVALQVCDANIADHVHQQILPLPFISMFLGDCLQKGHDCTDGGAKYNTTGLVGVGTSTCADSLHAIKHLVYEKKEISLSQYVEILKTNFYGEEKLRQYIINRLPKFGNDVDEVDLLAQHITEKFYVEVEKYKNYREGAFWPGLYSVSAQIGLGTYASASADGRLGGMPLSDGLSPMYGLDKSGPTACLKSLSKIDLSRAPNGVIVNQRLPQDLFITESGIDKLIELLRCFVALDGFHWQFNIVDNEVLRKAQQNPNEYKGLVVRVAGYSAIFVELSLKAQNSIIQRYTARL